MEYIYNNLVFMFDLPLKQYNDVNRKRFSLQPV